MRKSTGFILRFVPCAFVLALAGSSSAASAPPENELYAGWLKMYDLKFDEAHSTFGAWKQSHPADSLGPASNAAAYLFSDLVKKSQGSDGDEDGAGCQLLFIGPVNRVRSFWLCPVRRG